MRATFDQDRNFFVTTPGYNTPLSSISGKRGDDWSLDLAFYKNGELYELDADTEISSFKFGLKLPNDFNGVYVASNWDGSEFAYTKTGEGAAAIYTVAPSLSTAKINNMLGYDPDGFRQQTLITCAADEANGLRGKYFDIEAEAGTVRVWFKVGGVGDAPAAPAGGRLLEVDFATGATAEDVATAIATAIDADAAFTAESAGALITVEADTVGAREDSAAGDSGFDVVNWIQGSLPNTLTQKSSIPLVAELEVIQGGRTFSSPTIQVVVYNDLNKSTEGQPPSPTPAWPLPGKLALLAMFGDAAYEPAGADSVDVSPVLQQTFRVTAGGGGGAYTYVVVLKTESAKAGCLVDGYIELPASVNPMIEIREGAVDGTLLHTVAGNADAARYQNVRFAFDGTHFKKHFSGDIV